jgi:hypothetical protein
LEHLCAERGLMTDGAVETINEASFDKLDSALIEGVQANCSTSSHSVALVYKTPINIDDSLHHLAAKRRTEKHE